jgi:hypothetical protein
VFLWVLCAARFWLSDHDDNPARITALQNVFLPLPFFLRVLSCPLWFKVLTFLITAITRPRAITKSSSDPRLSVLIRGKVLPFLITAMTGDVGDPGDFIEIATCGT